MEYWFHWKLAKISKTVYEVYSFVYYLCLFKEYPYSLTESRVTKVTQPAAVNPWDPGLSSPAFPGCSQTS